MSSAAISHGYSASGAHVLGRGFKPSVVPDVRPIVFVVDEDDAVPESLKLVIRSEGWRSETFPSAQEFLAFPRASVPSCLVLGVSLPGFTGLELQKQLAVERPDIPIIFITGRVHVPTVVQAIKAGAIEFLTKPFEEEELLGAICVAMDRSHIALTQELEMRALRDCYASLTPREQQVMALVVAGLLNKQVAGELGISEITVKGHRGQVMQKMKANSVADLVKMAGKLHLTATL